MATYSSSAAYNAAMAQWVSDIKESTAAYFAAYNGDGIFTFELFYKFESLLAWGLTIPMPFQMEYPDTPFNRESWKTNVDTFYRAMVAGDLSVARPVEYLLPTPIEIADIPKFVKKKSRRSKLLKVLAIVAIICIGAIVIAGAMAGTAAGSAAAATGGSSAVATTAAAGSGAVASGVTTAAAATATGAGATAAAAGINATIIAAAKTGGAWLLKTAATAVLGNEVSQHFQKEIVEEQEKVAAQQNAAAATALEKEVAALEAQAAQAVGQSTTPPSSGDFNFLPVLSVVAAAFTFFN